jgi:hypothetical protein
MRQFLAPAIPFHVAGHGRFALGAVCLHALSVLDGAANRKKCRRRLTAPAIYGKLIVYAARFLRGGVAPELN